MISTDRVVQEFRNKLQAEFKKTASTIKVRYRSQELEAPGLAYITDLDKEFSLGEKVDPLSLVGSLNMICEDTGATLSKQTRGLQERPQNAVRLPLILLLESDNWVQQEFEPGLCRFHVDCTWICTCTIIPLLQCQSSSIKNIQKMQIFCCMNLFPLKLIKSKRSCHRQNITQN